MNEVNMKRVRATVASVGDFLKGKLAPLPDHPVRNSYAHVWRSIKEKFGTTYKEIPDERIEEVISFVERLISNDENHV